MKEIIKLSARAAKVDFSKDALETLAIGIFSDVKGLDKFGLALDRSAGGAISVVLSAGEFKGDMGSCEVAYSKGAAGPRRILLVGLGKREDADADSLRKAAAVAGKRAVAAKIEQLSLALHKAAPRIKPAAAARATVEGAYFGSYRYDEYVTCGENGRLAELAVCVVDDNRKTLADLRQGVAVGDVVGQAQCYGRTIANRPGNVINPPALAVEALRMAAEFKCIECTVMDKKQLMRKGMGGILAVGAGSAGEPRFIELKYTPARPRKGSPTIALVGKAITFDSGGISIKPPENMEQMKLDKSGGVAVLATMKAVAQLGLPLNVYGLIPAAENLPDGQSYRPGDIITTYSGKTVEILNTDAEGRMILCDAIAYAVQQKCDIIVDIATLTGACMVALVNHMAGLMTGDDKLCKALEKAAADSGEKLWRLPCGDEYAEQMKSKIADLRNIGGKWGGACTAAAFLRQFAGEARWAHLDIAGMDIFAQANAYAAEGSTAFGVRLLTAFLMHMAGGNR